MGAQKIEEHLAGVPEGGQVLAVDHDEPGADPGGLGQEHQLADAEPARVVVARREDVLLLDPEGPRPERRVPVLEDLGVEAVIVLAGGWHWQQGAPITGSQTHKLQDDAVVAGPRARRHLGQPFHGKGARDGRSVRRGSNAASGRANRRGKWRRQLALTKTNARCLLGGSSSRELLPRAPPES